MRVIDHAVFNRIKILDLNIISLIEIHRRRLGCELAANKVIEQALAKIQQGRNERMFIMRGLGHQLDHGARAAPGRNRVQTRQQSLSGRLNRL